MLTVWASRLASCLDINDHSGAFSLFCLTAGESYKPVSDNPGDILIKFNSYFAPRTWRPCLHTNSEVSNSSILSQAQKFWMVSDTVVTTPNSMTAFLLCSPELSFVQIFVVEYHIFPGFISYSNCACRHTRHPTNPKRELNDAQQNRYV